MAPSSMIVASSPLSLVVVLPEAIPPGSGRHNLVAPPLISRKSGSAIPKVQQAPGHSAVNNGGGGIDDALAAQGRRLSLAPGVESKLAKSRVTPMMTPSPSMSADSAPAVENLSVDGTPHRRTMSAPRKNSLGPESNYLSSAALQKPRASVAYPGGLGLTQATMGRTRAGTEGDELVDLFRGFGMEVTVVRQLAHLSNIVGGQEVTPSQSSSESDVQRVILVPLGDAPPLPSLSIMFSQGTTPSAVHFQQDLIERAKKTEEAWIAHAVERIKQVRETLPPMSTGDDDKDPLILGYIAQGALSPTSISGCLGAGASGVLQPPFSAKTVINLTELVRAASYGNAASVALSSPAQSVSSHFSPSIQDDASVVLTPTALANGAQHESEKVLSARMSQRRKMSTAMSLDGVASTISLGSARGSVGSADAPGVAEPLMESTSSDATGPNASPKTPLTSLTEFDFPSTIANKLLAVHNAHDARRRSVDTGGLARAFNRAAGQGDKAVQKSTDESSQRINVVAGDSEQASANGHNTTEFAEMLSELYHQTMTSIDIQMGDYEAMAAELSHEDRSRLVSALDTWDFKPHELDQRDLYRVACLVFESVLNTEGVIELGIDFDQMKRWLFAVRSIYHAPNPYHNYVHAIDVLQATYQFLCRIGVAPPFSFLLDREQGKTVWRRPTEKEQPTKGRGTVRARSILRPQDVLAVVIAAMGHDVGHPGLSNAFMKNAKVPLSLVYDDKSVLENMHCMLSVHLLRKHGFRFLLEPATSDETLDYPARGRLDWRGFRRVLYSTILATDMSLHFAWIHRLKELAEIISSGDPLDRDELVEEDRVMISQALIKCADISNPTRPIDISEHWSAVLLDEWGKQASLEEELALPVSVVAGVDARLQAKGQVGFIDLFTFPLFRAAADILPEMEVFTESCLANRQIWQDRLEALEADEDANEQRTEALRATVGAPLPCSEDGRYATLFPLILPDRLAASVTSPADAADGGGATYAPDAAGAATTDPASSPLSAMSDPNPHAPRVVPPSPDVKAVRIVYRDAVDGRSLLERNLLALIGFDPAHGSRRMSTPDALLVHTP